MSLYLRTESNLAEFTRRQKASRSDSGSFSVFSPRNASTRYPAADVLYRRPAVRAAEGSGLFLLRFTHGSPLDQSS